jgi:ribosomal protein S27AE
MTHKPESCPRCGGNLVLDRDEYSYYQYCLQCGYQREPVGTDNFHRQSGRVGGKTTAKHR